MGRRPPVALLNQHRVTWTAPAAVWSGRRGGGGGWHKASVSDCLPLAAPIGLSPLLTGGGGQEACTRFQSKQHLQTNNTSHGVPCNPFQFDTSLCLQCVIVQRGGGRCFHSSMWSPPPNGGPPSPADCGPHTGYAQADAGHCFIALPLCRGCWPRPCKTMLKPLVYCCPHRQ